MGLKQLRWLLIAQCVLLVGLLGAAACGSGDDDDDATTDDDHAHDACNDEDHHSEEAAEGDGGEDADHDAQPVGPESGATCPAGSTLTYDNFGKQFMSDYCVRCHSSELKACEDRNGAPLGHDFDSLLGILSVGNHVDQMAAAGPDKTNTTMPPDDGPKPTEEQRKQLGEWLACELDKLD